MNLDAVGNVKYFWYTVWTGNSEFFGEGELVALDTEELNCSMFFGFLFDTIPLLVVQFLNNYYAHGAIDKWNDFLMVTFISSCYMALSGIWKCIYWRFYRGVSWKDVPVSMVNLAIMKTLHIDPSSSKKSNSAYHVLDKNANEVDKITTEIVALSAAAGIGATVYAKVVELRWDVSFWIEY